MIFRAEQSALFFFANEFLYIMKDNPEDYLIEKEENNGTQGRKGTK